MNRARSTSVAVSRRDAASLLVTFVLLTAATALHAQGSKADYERAANLSRQFSGKVFRDRVQANWEAGNTSFWYEVKTARDASEFVWVNAVTGERKKLDRAPDGRTTNSASSASRGGNRSGSDTSLTFINRTQGEVEIFWLNDGQRQSYGKISPGAQREQHTFAGHAWVVVDAAGKTLGNFEGQESASDAIITTNAVTSTGRPRGNRGGGAGGAQRPQARETSPDGKWRALIKDFNVVLKEISSGEETVLTTDGKEGDAYRERFYWSPNSQRVVAVRVAAGQERKVHIVDSSPRDQLQPKLVTFDYYKPGDKLPHPRPALFDVVAKKQIPVSDALFPNPFTESGSMDIRWEKDSSRFTFRHNQRGHQVLRIIAVDAKTGEASAIVDEQSKTFIDYSGKNFLEWLDDTGELIWMSERDGWNHLYLYDAKTGRVKNQITKGEWVVRGVDKVDKEKRQIWFRAGGIHPGQDPYHIHYARVNFDGSSLVALTDGDGTRAGEPQFSSDMKFLVDTYSRVDMPTVTELRRVSDGKLVTKLEAGELSELIKAGWRAPERFVAKARDGETDIYGVIVRPTNFDPTKKYPVIENIYAGPQGSFTPKTFSAVPRMQELAELGFIVVQMDGMGTSHRSKKFHDVCWKNIGDAGFPDRILWIKAAAAKYPEMDLTRVGIYGTSAGGQNALGGLLTHGDFYKAGVSDCGCHDNRMDKIWWNEQWMGWPVDKHYDEQSNVTLAKNLQGKLLLMVGELDKNVDPASTTQVVNALIKANKDFDYLVVPGAGHGVAGSPYGKRRLQDFFVKNLLGKEPRWN
jgi:dipeptidyl-peptidase-4